MKVYKGEEERIEPPPEGWGVLIFSDGRKAEVAGAVFKENFKGDELIEMYLRPYPETIRKFKIDAKSELDRQGFVWKSYPRDVVIPLNTYDPVRKVFFSLYGWDGKRTEATDWFLGNSQTEEIRRLRKIIIKLRSELAIVKGENTMLKEDVDQYITKNGERIFKLMSPLLRGMLMPEHKERVV